MFFDEDSNNHFIKQCKTLRNNKKKTKKKTARTLQKKKNQNVKFLFGFTLI